MPYYGQVEIEVRLMREGHGVEGKDMAPVAHRIVRMEEFDAKELRGLLEANPHNQFGLLLPVAKAVKEVLDDDEAVELDRRWRDAVSSAPAERKRAALAVLEGND
jgi:hypothetical protein